MEPGADVVLRRAGGASTAERVLVLERRPPECCACPALLGPVAVQHRRAELQGLGRPDLRFVPGLDAAQTCLGSKTRGGAHRQPRAAEPQVDVGPAGVVHRAGAWVDAKAEPLGGAAAVPGRYDGDRVDTDLKHRPKHTRREVGGAVLRVAGSQHPGQHAALQHVLGWQRVGVALERLRDQKPWGVAAEF